MKPRRLILIAVLLIGFTAMIAQIILMRELIIVFYGNELSIGVILACWLLWGAVGSWGLGRFADRIKGKIATLALCEIFLGLLLPSAVLAIRAVKPVIRLAPGEIIGFSSMAYSSFIVLAPICIILGFLFALGCRVYTPETAQPGGPNGNSGSKRTGASKGASQIGYVYILEAIGASTGGLLCSFLLIRYLDSLHIMMGLGLLNLIGAFSLQSILTNRSKWKPWLLGFVSVLIIANLSLFLSGGLNRLRRFSLDLQWRGFNRLVSRNSIYGNIVVTQRGAQRSFFNNGLHMFTVPDELSSEEAVHFALLEHPNPERVLLIGGGVGGLLEEILKHPIRSVDYVELDPLIIQLAHSYLAKADSDILQDERVKVINTDGRLFIKRAKGQEYDCIIINLPDPFTAQLNRFYTLKFFREAKEILSKGGVISFGVTSSENYVSGELQKFLSCIHKTLSQVFADVKMVPGDLAYFLASPQDGALTYDYNILMARLRERGVEAKYVREYYLFSKLSSERIDYLEGRIGQVKEVEINRDFRPICYYYDMVLWTTYFNPLFQRIFRAVTEERIWGGALGFYFLIMFFALLRKRFPAIRKRSVLVAVTTTGFAELAFEVTVLLSFQVIYGYMYYKLGLILTSFMVGLTFGGWWATTLMARLKKDFTAFVWTQASICIYPLILPLVFWWLAASHGKATNWLGANIIFPFLPIIAGFIGGFQFPLANKIYLGQTEQVGRIAGLSYAVDLLGACVGALLVSAFLLPILGIPKTCLAVALLNISCLVLLILCRRDL